MVTSSGSTYHCASFCGSGDAMAVCSSPLNIFLVYALVQGGAQDVLQVRGRESERSGSAPVRHAPLRIDQDQPVGPAGVQALDRIVDAVNQRREVDSEV